MFEYLMPLLILRGFANSLLEDAYRQAVSTQIDFAVRRGVPWGISEAAFSALDMHRIYQYQAFGVPGLGVQRGLEDDLVVAPYATALALQFAPWLQVPDMATSTRGLAATSNSCGARPTRHLPRSTTGSTLNDNRAPI